MALLGLHLVDREAFIMWMHAIETIDFTKNKRNEKNIVREAMPTGSLSAVRTMKEAFRDQVPIA
ncbi:hypothetical protein [Mesorhizobium hawassense]|uniref:hypothetical protein n=1 Tax=Mesorhizobium hawassense TaxID=1209954 RepID=UPI00142D73CE|nr:hypothetical protein [Mesorhizobium hawassense]